MNFYFFHGDSFLYKNIYQLMIFCELNNKLAQLGNLTANVICSQVQSGYVNSSVIPLIDAHTKTIYITDVIIQGVVGLTADEIALMALTKNKVGFSIVCGDSNLNAKIAGKCLGITIMVS